MSIKYKIDVIEALSKKGYSTYKMRKDKILSEGTIQKFRDGEMISWNKFDKLCELLDCQPGDIIKYVKEEKSQESD